MRRFQDLIVWQKAHRLALDIYGLTRTFPRHEQFIMVPQMRRGSRSVAANIAEGSGLRSLPSFRHHLDIAAGSTSELEYDLLLARDLSYIPPSTQQQLTRRVIEVRKMLHGLAGWTLNA